MIKPTKTKVDSDSGKAENSKTKASAKKSGQTEKSAVSTKTTAASKKTPGQESNAETKQSLKKENQKSLSDDLVKIIEARHHDPFSILGRHQKGNKTSITAYLPYAETVKLGNKGPELTRIPYTDFFEILLDPKDIQGHYRLNWIDKQGFSHEHHDPYDFGPILTDFDQHLFGEGKHWHIYKKLGAHLDSIDNVSGVRFAVWAPNAGRVSVVGDFNHWDGRCHPMRSLGGSGIWEIFIPDVNEGAYYKFEIRNRNSSAVMVKTDPYGLQFEYRPKTSSIVTKEDNYTWNDQQWIDQRSKFDWMHQPMSVYEVHLGSWRRDNLDNFLSYRELAKQLVDYVVEMGYTHIELLPINEHPLDISWGYQSTGYFAPTSRFGKPDDFRYFIDMCHQNNIGVILDWVPAHFPKDGFALAQFDGSALYEHEDPRKGEHRDWGTLIYNYGRNEVKNFLISSAFFWMEEYHIDGLRVDAVASMLYLDYSREDGDWIPNQYGGNENLEAIEFLREMNEITHQEHPGSVIMAEESTAWPQVTRPVWTGGLGFSMKWNMGWMHDTLSYMSADPVHRMHHHDQLTFGLLYAFTENFVLPFSHDEVVHGKNSMINKMPGDEWQRFANLRLLYTLMYVYPGKKLLFMGCEFGQGTEWNSTQQLDWYVLDYPNHQGVQSLVKDLNKLYKDHPALHDRDFDHEGFAWIDCHDVSKSIISFMRKSENETIIAVFNFTPVPRENYRIGVPEPGTYHEVLNSDSSFYNGSNTGNGFVNSDEIVWMEQPHSINLTLPPLAGIVLKI